MVFFLESISTKIISLKCSWARERGKISFLFNRMSSSVPAAPWSELRLMLLISFFNYLLNFVRKAEIGEFSSLVIQFIQLTECIRLTYIRALGQAYLLFFCSVLLTNSHICCKQIPTQLFFEITHPDTKFWAHRLKFSESANYVPRMLSNDINFIRITVYGHRVIIHIHSYSSIHVLWAW